MGHFVTLSMIGRRLAGAIPSVIGVIVVTFVLTRALPGDPAAFFAGPAASAQAIQEVRTKLGLDRSMLGQFVVYMRAIAHGDLGTSLTTGQRVLHDLLTRLPASLELTLCALCLAVGVALPLGVWAATHPDSWIDHAARVLTTAGVSLPTFFTGLTLVYVFYFLLGWVPAPLGRLDVFLSPPDQVTGFYLVDSLLMGDPGLFWACLRQLMLPAPMQPKILLRVPPHELRNGLHLVVERDHQRQQPRGGLAGLYVHRRHPDPASTHDGRSPVVRGDASTVTTSILPVSGAENRTSQRWGSTPGVAAGA